MPHAVLLMPLGGSTGPKIYSCCFTEPSGKTDLVICYYGTARFKLQKHTPVRLYEHNMSIQTFIMCFHVHKTLMTC